MESPLNPAEVLLCFQKKSLSSLLQATQRSKGRNDFGPGCCNGAYLVQKRSYATHNDKKDARNSEDSAVQKCSSESWIISALVASHLRLHPTLPILRKARRRTARDQESIEIQKSFFISKDSGVQRDGAMVRLL